MMGLEYREALSEIWNGDGTHPLATPCLEDERTIPRYRILISLNLAMS